MEDEATQRRIISSQLEKQGYQVLAAEDGRQGIALWQENPGVRVVITDLLMPDVDGFAVLEHIRSHESHYTYIIVLTGLDDREALVRALTLGADDYVTKPIFTQELVLRLQGASRLLRLEGQDELIFAMAELAAYRSGETGSHLNRVRKYCQLIGDDLYRHCPELGLTKTQVQDIVSVSPLHDIGKVGIPDSVLHKPGRLNDGEYELMKTHTSMGGQILKDLYDKNGSNYLKMAHEIALFHHEKWDGSGYPQGLVGEHIPLAARIMALADVFDALTSKRCYKDVFSFERAKSILLEEKGKHFDPLLVESYLRNEMEMNQIQLDFREEGNG